MTDGNQDTFTECLSISDTVKFGLAGAGIRNANKNT